MGEVGNKPNGINAPRVTRRQSEDDEAGKANEEINLKELTT